jgi:hypothetical protein
MRREQGRVKRQEAAPQKMWVCLAFEALFGDLKVAATLAP